MNLPLVVSQRSTEAGDPLLLALVLVFVVTNPNASPLGDAIGILHGRASSQITLFLHSGRSDTIGGRKTFEGVGSSGRCEGEKSGSDGEELHGALFRI
jgi:hypothetical protein